MSRKANPAVVGVFIIGAVVLAVVAAALLASGTLFSGYTTFVTYFSEPVNGLSVGAPVKYRGIQLGEVSRIGLFQTPQGQGYAEVHYEAAHSRLENLGGTQDMVSESRVELLVKEGLRARLEVESIVTGVVFVTLEFKEDAGPPELVNPASDVVEIPSTLSPLSELTESAGEVIARLSTIDVVRISENILRLTETIQERIDEVQLNEIVDNMSVLSARLNELTSNPELDHFAPELRTTLEEFRETNRIVQDRVARFDPAVAKIDTIAVQMHEVASSLAEASEKTSEMLEGDAEFRRSLEQALSETASTMKSLGRFLDMLERNPNVIVAGKPEGQK